MIFVSHNRHKFEEITEIFEKRGLDLQWKNLEYEEIQADSTEVISRSSCNSLKGEITGDFFIEDTGLYIDSLHGFPGPYSSYVVERIGLPGILKLLEGKDRNAHFLTVVSACLNGEIMQFSGVSQGSISHEARGDFGFGYDPIFIPEGSKKTLSEMTITEKNSVSHRARAVSLLLDFLIKL